VGPIAGYGSTLGQFGSGLAILIGHLRGTTVGLFAPAQNSPGSGSEVRYQPSVRLVYTFDPANPLQILRILTALRQWEPSLIVFDLTPTTLGKSTLPNLTLMILPLLSRVIGGQEVVAVLHNSATTTDYGQLGYVRLYDKLRGRALRLLEFCLFTTVQTVFLLQSYQRRAQLVTKSQVGFDPFWFVEGIPSLTTRESPLTEVVTRKPGSDKKPTILMHGNWGPQKDIEAALRALRELKSHKDFHLQISGKLNPSFPSYYTEFERAVLQFADLSLELLGELNERQVREAFTRADVVVLPYRTSGGRSGVIELAKLYDCKVVAPRLREIEDQTAGRPGVILFESGQILEGITEALSQVSCEQDSQIDFRLKVRAALECARDLLQRGHKVPGS
jgi:glycosyltransferase involved in cell wall biosynthesis